LAEAGVRHCLLRDRPADLEILRDVDLLVHPAERRVAFAALERAGFMLRRERRLRQKWVFLRFTGQRFVAIDVHAACVQGGIEYMSAVQALSRRERSGPVPRLCREDQFLHLLLHNLLGKPALQDKHRQPLRDLHRAGLDPERLEAQTRAYGLRDIVAAATTDLEALLADPAAWQRLARQARRTLLRHPTNALAAQ
jgi:hypothetical protein